MPAVGGWRVEMIGWENSGEGCGRSWLKLGYPSAVGWDGTKAELVPGRDTGGGVGLALVSSKLKSDNSLLVKGEDGREEFGMVDSIDWPKTRPVAAAATTVPVPTSC